MNKHSSINPFEAFDKARNETKPTAMQSKSTLGGREGIKSTLETDRLSRHAHAAGGNVKKERVYVENSLGGESTQGCQEHYYERTVRISDVKTAKESSGKSELAKMIIMGEALNNPRFKSKWSR